MKFLCKKFVQKKKYEIIIYKKKLNFVNLNTLNNVYIYDLNLIKLNMLLLYFIYKCLVIYQKN